MFCNNKICKLNTFILKLKNNHCLIIELSCQKEFSALKNFGKNVMSFIIMTIISLGFNC